MSAAPLPAAAEFWNDRYESEEYAYGTAPNAYFRQQLDKLAPGLLLLAEGEGRNAVYAARCGWQVTAVDFSDEAAPRPGAWPWPRAYTSTTR